MLEENTTQRSPEAAVSLGRACLQDLIAHGYEVINADIVPPKESLCPFYKIDFENMAQTGELLWAMDFEHIVVWTQLFTWRRFLALESPPGSGTE